jgi:hypothetical protein
MLFRRRRLVDSFDDAEIMFGVLQKVFRPYPIAAGRRVARQRLILFMHLPSVAANAQIAAIAVKRLVA